MFFSKADMGLTRRQEKCVFPISACKLTGGLHFSVQGVHDGTFLGIEFPVPVEVYAAVVFNVQRASGFHQYIGILDGAAVHLQRSAFEYINPVSVAHLQGLARRDFECAGAYDEIVGERATSPFGG